MCTGITLTAKDGSIVRGRTMEFSVPLESNIIVVPRGLAMQGTGPDGKPDGLPWTVKYGTAGVNGLGMNMLVDGVNEQGLSGGLFYFPSYAGFQDVPAADAGRSIAAWELLTWALTSFATVAEVKAALPDVLVNTATLAGLGGIVPPFHWYLADAANGRIAVEYVDGALKVHDAPLGTFTNAPTFDWHLTNLGNYVGLDAQYPAAIDVDGVTIAAPSTGVNMLGLPGDYSSPSRFVRATVFSALLPQQATGAAAIMAGYHLLDSFDIPEGTVPEPKGSTPPFEITEWTTMSDMTNKVFTVWTAENRAIRRVTLGGISLDGKGITIIPLDQEQEFVDLTVG